MDLVGEFVRGISGRCKAAIYSRLFAFESSAAFAAGRDAFWKDPE